MTTRIKKLAIVVAAVWWVALLGAAETYELPDFRAQDPYVDSVRFALMGLKDTKFYSRGDRHGVNVLTNKPATAFTYKVWLQDQPAPLVTLVPGLGGHCASLAPTVLAESLFSHGLSVLVVSSPFNWEFVENGSSVVTPGYTPQDARDMYVALQAAVADIDKRYGPGKITRHLLAGYSLGGLDVLFMAEIDAREQRFKFDRVVAINPPVNLLYGLKQLDDSYQTWTNWAQPSLESKKNKAVNFYEKHMRTPLTPEEQVANTNAVLPFAGDEARLAMGMVFRRSLGEVIKAVHKRRNYGVLEQQYQSGRTRFLEKEIERYGYAHYIMTFLKESYSNLWVGEFTSKDLNKKASLPAITPFLASNPAVRVIHTRDDFLLTDYDREWLGRVLGSRLSFFDHGGHLGFLYRADAMEFIAWQLGHGINPLVKAGTSSTGSVAAASVTAAPAVSVSVTAAPAVSASVTAAPAVSVSVTAAPAVSASVTAAPAVSASVTAAPAVSASVTAATTAAPPAVTTAPVMPIATTAPSKAETTATVEMADEGITRTATVVRAMPVSTAVSNATVEYIDQPTRVMTNTTPTGVMTNDTGITIEFHGE